STRASCWRAPTSTTRVTAPDSNCADSGAGWARRPAPLSIVVSPSGIVPNVRSLLGASSELPQSSVHHSWRAAGLRKGLPRTGSRLAIVENERVLVTGGAGFIGRAVVTALRRSGAEVTVVDRLPSEVPGVESVVGELSDPAIRQRAVDRDL